MQPSRASAAPANPNAHPITQPNGIVFAAVGVGDEFANATETHDGFTIVFDNTSRYWSYATLDRQGLIIPSTRRVGIDSPVPFEQHLRAKTTFPKSEVDQALTLNAAQHQTRYKATGNQPVLGILVAFTNQSAVASSTEDWNNVLFAPANSMADFYAKASYNQLRLIPATETHGTANDGIVGWVHLPYAHPNLNGFGDQLRQVARDAVAAADPFINFAAFDANSDGLISAHELHLVLVYAGYEGSYATTGSCGNSVWAHRANMSAAATADGVKLMGSLGDGGYVAIGEWHCAPTQPPGHRATIGPLVHELGHDMGLPDLYDIDLSSNGVGNWSSMGTGSWNYMPGQDFGTSPAYFDAFSKTYLSWLTPTHVATDSPGLSVLPAATHPTALQMVATAPGHPWTFRYASGTGEYFLIENRQKIGYDTALPGCGLLIWHIDETAVYTSGANATDTQRLVDLEEADNKNDLDRVVNTGDSGDAYPGSTNATAFNRFTKPASFFNTGAFAGITVTNISASSAGCASVTPSTAVLAPLPASGSITADFIVGVPNASAATATATPTSAPTPTPSPLATPSRTATTPTPASLNNLVFLPTVLR